MIMQKQDGDVDFFSDILCSPQTSALRELDAPMDNWRFIPRNTGRLYLRTDLVHQPEPSGPQVSLGRSTQSGVTVHLSDTLFYG